MLKKTAGKSLLDIGGMGTENPRVGGSIPPLGTNIDKIGVVVWKSTKRVEPRPAVSFGMRGSSGWPVLVPRRRAS